MNDRDWTKQRERAISLTFQTGRPVFADSEGTFRFADGDQEAISGADEPAAPDPIAASPYRDPVTPDLTPYARRRSYRVHVTNAVTKEAPSTDVPETGWWTRVKRWFGGLR